MEKDNLQNLKIAIVVEELTQLGGAERLLDYYLELFPKAPVYTLVWDKAKTLHCYDKFDIRPSFIQKLPGAIKHYKWYLLLMPKAVESFDLKNYDLVLSITSALVKGVKTKRNQIHICYCNTPTRWLWSDSQSYLKTAPIPIFAKPLIPVLIKYLRKWDLKAAMRPDYFIANSENVRKRIKKYYGRDSYSIFVPVDCQKFHQAKKEGQYFLVVSRLEPYKKVDLVIDAFRKLKLALRIVGGGTGFERFKNSLSKNIKLLGRLSDEDLAKTYSQAKAVIFAQEEDAGIVPLEAMAAGRPVIAYAKGGALETVIDSKTGILFEKQTAASLQTAIKRFQTMKFSPKVLRVHALKFDKELFKKKIMKYIIDKLKAQMTNIKIKESLH